MVSEPRHNLLSGRHYYVSSSVLEIDEEFRKQGCAFANAQAITFQECSNSVRIKEDIFKRLVSGEKMACRPN